MPKSACAEDWPADDTDLESDEPLSIAQLCFHYRRPHFLRAACQLTWPGADRYRKPAAVALRTLSTRSAFGVHARVSLAHYAAFRKREQSVEFIALAMELDPDDDCLSRFPSADQEAGALITAARMLVHLRSQEPQVAPGAVPAAGVDLTLRRRSPSL